MTPAFGYLEGDGRGPAIGSGGGIGADEGIGADGAPVLCTPWSTCWLSCWVSWLAWLISGLPALGPVSPFATL